jgi:hypothetical protein
MTRLDLAALARSIVDASLYMVLGTADVDGRPWVSPVYFAPHDYREFFWVSDPGARHSTNVAARPDVSIVVFDSRQAIGTGKAVYIDALAEQVTGADGERGLAVFSERSLAHGGHAWTAELVEAPARLRLYRATATARYVVDGDDRRVSVEP